MGPDYAKRYEKLVWEWNQTTQKVLEVGLGMGPEHTKGIRSWFRNGTRTHKRYEKLVWEWDQTMQKGMRSWFGNGTRLCKRYEKLVWEWNQTTQKV
jgi:hypothetical protein